MAKKENKSKPLLQFTQCECWIAIFRIVVGVFFAYAGISKFGMDGFMLGVGIVESIVGVLLVLGLFTRLAAAVGIIIMVGALATVHFPMTWNIFANNSERAFLYLASFLVFLTKGATAWSLEKAIFKREIF